MSDRRTELLDVLNDLDVSDVQTFLHSTEWDDDQQVVIREWLVDTFPLDTLRRWAGHGD